MTKQSNHTVFTAANDNPGGQTTVILPLSGMIHVITKAFVSIRSSAKQPKENSIIAASPSVDGNNGISQFIALSTSAETSPVQR